MKTFMYPSVDDLLEMNELFLKHRIFFLDYRGFLPNTQT